MEIQNRHGLKAAAAALVLTLAAMPVQARQQKERADSLVRIMKAESLELMEKGGQKFRKAVSSTFLHNGTYLISDTALWNVDTKVINAWGHVKVIQDETILTSDKLDYFIDDNLAQFRGTTVQLQNKKNNQLRTRHLDYNTRDSLAVFKGGAAMRDKDGQVIESLSGRYDSHSKVFTFESNVNMFSDSIFVKTERLLYFSETERAEFPALIDFWKGGNMLSAGNGWYDRGQETFFFQRDVHGLNDKQEVWSDSLYFYRVPNDVLLLGHAQVLDSTRRVSAMADRIQYTDSLSRVMLRRNAAVIMETEHDSVRDTIYMGADTLIYHTIARCDIAAGTVKACETRLADISTDAVTEYRRKAAKEAQERAEQAKQNMVGPGARQMKPDQERKTPPEEDNSETPEDEVGPDEASDDPAAVADSLLRKQALTAPLDSAVAAIDRLTEKIASGDELDADSDMDAPPAVLSREDSIALAESMARKAVEDSLRQIAIADSLARQAILDSIAQADSARIRDSLAVLDSLRNRDTTAIGFIYGIRNVRIFRNDIQVRCDSMAYCDLDSIARFYMDPIVWNDGKRQYTSDSLFILIGAGGPRKASLQSNAFVITEENEVSYDQIKGAEIMAYFDSTDNSLKRFDALGGASALFYIRENEVFATVNKVETKMLSAILVNGNMDQVSYFEAPKNNAYPVVQMPEADRKMKGFNWRPEERPEGPWDITTIIPRKPSKGYYRSKPRPAFRQTDIYFPGYMAGVRREIAVRDSLARIPRPHIDTSAISVPDSLTLSDTLALKDTLLVRDSLHVKPGTQADSLKTPAAPADSTRARADSLKLSVEETDPLSVPTADPKQKKKEEQELRRQLRIAARDARMAAREARWAELDRQDSLKVEAKKQKELDRKRAKTLKALKAKLKQDAKDEAKLQKFIEKYQKKHEREQARNASRKRSPASETGGKVPAPDEPGEPPAGSDAVLGDDGPVDDGPVLGGGGLPGT